MTEAETISLLNKRVTLRQPEGGFRPGLDSVMLAAACKVKSGEHILDLGCGVGSAGLCVLTRAHGTTLTGIDILEENIALASENAVLNGLEDRAEFIVSCIKNILPHPNPLPEGRGNFRFDHVICNPPYLEDGAHSPSPDGARAIANGHDETSLEDWLRAAFNSLKSGGSLTMIHRADMVDKIIQGLGRSYGAIEIIPLWPKAGVAAKRVIVRAVKDRKSPAILNPGLVLHEENGDYTAAAEAVLRNAAAL